jgi:hypothetical protein
MTRGRHHNRACVITEPAGDEHTRREPPAAAEVLARALRKTSNEKSATETLRDELDDQGRSTGRQAAILESLRQTHAHSLNEAIRKETRRQAFTHAIPAPEPTIDLGIEL